MGDLTENFERNVVSERLEDGTLISGRYLIKQTIASGGMATVYLVHDELDESVKALKVLHREFASDKAYVERFIREVRLLNKVTHPHVIKTYDVSIDRDLIYFSMEYVEGDSIERLMTKRSLDQFEIADLIVQICEGLEAIHAKGIIHRDLKPGNILVTNDGSIKILDFGVAREKYSRLTSKHQKVGSMCYMAPEIWMGRPLTPSVDLYAFGVVLYELLTGRVPFEHDFPGGLMQMHLKNEPQAPKELNPAIPDWLNMLILKLLDKSPKARPGSAREVINYVKDRTEQRNRSLHSSPEQRSEIDAAVTDWPPLSADDPLLSPSHGKISVRQAEARRQRTYVLRLSATQVFEDRDLAHGIARPRRRATMVIPLPRRAAVVFEIDRPSRDFIYFGIFFASLQILDGVLTSVGLDRFGHHAEGNPLLRHFMGNFSTTQVLVLAKVFAVLLIVLVTVLAKRLRWIKDLIGFLSCFYLCAAIIPWLYILFFR